MAPSIREVIRDLHQALRSAREEPIPTLARLVQATREPRTAPPEEAPVPEPEVASEAVSRPPKSKPVLEPSAAETAPPPALERVEVPPEVVEEPADDKPSRKPLKPVREDCPICFEYEAVALWRGKKLCKRCLRDLRGW